MDAQAPAPQSSRVELAAHWQLDLLGGVRATSAASTLQRWPSRAVAALLARLSLAPQRAYSREELIELLWPGVSLERGRPRLRQALSNLRSLLERDVDAMPTLLLADRQTVRLAPGAVACDVLQFERLLADGEPARARALYAGELMPGFYEDWIVAERHRLEALHAGLPAPGVPDAVRPSVPVAPTSPPPPEAALRLPVYWTRAFGQDEALAGLVRTVATQRLVTVLGPGGNGKTRLAVAAGVALVEQRPAAFDGVAFVPLADAGDRQAVWDGLSLALGGNGGGDPARSVLAAIGQRRTLLLLDNVEQLDGDAPEVLTQLLRQAPTLHLLLTSRRRLGLDGEQVVEMPGLPVPTSSGEAPDVPSLAANPAVALFVDRARQSRPEFHLTAHNAAAVADLVRLLGGMPLAIELAASRLRALQPRDLLLRLREDAGSPLLDLLARPTTRATAQSRHASMRHVVQWSWRQLPLEVAALLRAMSVLSAPVTLQAVTQALAGLRAPGGPHADGGGAPDAAAVQALLADAVDTSLVQCIDMPLGAARRQSDTRRHTAYALLPPVREFAAEQCAADEPGRVRGRLRRWLAGQANDGLPRRRAELQPDLAHAWGLLLRSRDDGAAREALALTVSMQGEWNNRPSSLAVLAVLDWALAQLPQGVPDALASQGHYMMAALCQLRAEVDAAAVHAEAAVRAAPDDRCRVLGLSIRCWIGLERGDDPGRVRRQLDEALRLARRSGDARAQAFILRNLASLAVNHFEDHAAAEPLLVESVRLFERQGDVAQAWLRQIDLAACWARTGRADAALALLEECVRQCRAMRLAINLIYALTALGSVRLRLGDPQAARAPLEQAARLAQRQDWSALLWPALLPLSEAWLRCGRVEPAARLHGQVVSRWTATLGRFTRVDARAARRTRRLLGLALGSARAAALMQAGAAMPQDEVLGPIVDNAESPRAGPVRPAARAAANANGDPSVVP